MLQKWESKWQMAFNADKCFVIRAGTKRKTIKQDYTIHNHILDVVEESKYLGVTISKDLTWNAPSTTSLTRPTCITEIGLGLVYNYFI
jgi:hypothetical protein